MNQHDLDILELGLRVKNEIWAENRGQASARMAIMRRCAGDKWIFILREAIKRGTPFDAIADIIDAQL